MRIFVIMLDEYQVRRGASLGVRAPLDERTARSVAQQIFAAGRGPILPEEPVKVGAAWRHETPLATALGFEGKTGYSYKYLRREGTIAVIAAEGRVEGRSNVGST